MSTTTRPDYTLDRTASPSTLPVELAKVKKQLELQASGSVHDDQLTDAIWAAAEQVETDTGYGLTDSTYVMYLDEFPPNDMGCFIKVPIRPIQSITSIKYQDADDSQQTLATTVYKVNKPARKIFLKVDQEWPTIAPQKLGIEITFLIGFGSSATNIPRLIKQALLLQVGNWFQDRDMLVDFDTVDNTYETIIKRFMTPHYP